MDYSQICQGWIYTITNKVNGKMYVGQTINLKKRRYQHFVAEETCPLLNKAFKKYGKENFEMKIILTFKAINREVCDKILNWFEIYYIDKYNSFGEGYNVTKGGEGHYGHTPSEKTKRKLSEFNIGKKPSLEERIKMSRNATSRPEEEKVPILQYDLNGNYIREWEYAALASQYLAPGKNKYGPAIYKACRETHRQILGYMWRFKDFITFPLTIPPYKEHNQINVYYYSKIGTLLGQYRSVGEASEATGIPKGTIRSSLRYSSSKALSSQRTFLKKNYWSHEPPKEKEGI